MKIAVVQMDVTLGQIDSNLNKIIHYLRITRESGAHVTIFPECALTGYCFATLDEAKPFAQSIPGPATERIQNELCSLGGAAVFGLIEDHADGIFNSAVFVTANGVKQSYRKIHLPYLGIDQFATHGDRPFTVHEYEGIRFGLSICYDSAFPESMRLLALQGADVILLPTNFPSGADSMVDHVMRTRALENKVYFACCNRVGEERGFPFIGQSQIVEPSGHLAAKASADQEEVLYAEINPELARNKRVGRSSVMQAIDRMADRRPEMYGGLLTPHALPRPGRDAN
ncbi:carbon-nitrogen hydrolase family protein [Planctomicrobium sp. SH527]|uniref:carbon-nitrogen hydrolase family protein n=1 Tax=Planctomicrobium sp. SH527 TaxID=3448123 RepID=UPI003F5BE02E